jgi:hypothetical protein
MLPNEVDAEIEKLKAKKIELTSKLNLAEEFEEKEQLESEIAKIQQQIEVLEKLKSKS